MKQANELAKTISARKALDAFGRHVDGKAIIETDGIGSRLFRAARHVVLLASFAAAGLGAAGAAAEPLQVPGKGHAEAFRSMASHALENSKRAGLFGLSGIGEIEEDSDCAEIHEYGWSRHVDRDNVAGYSSSSRINYYDKLNLPYGIDLRHQRAIKGVAECLRIAAEERFGETSVLGPRGKRVFSDVAGILAALKYAPDDRFFKSMADVEASTSLMWAMNGTQRLRDESLVRLDAVGRVMDIFGNDPEAAERFRRSEMWHLPRIAMAITAHAEKAVAKANVPPSAVYHIGQHAAAAKLESLGLKASASAARHVAGNGLIKDDVCNEMEMHFESGYGKGTGNEDVFCPLRRDPRPEEWKTAGEVEARFQTDTAKYIDSLLPPKAEQTSSLKR